MVILRVRDVANQATVAKNNAQLRMLHAESTRSVDIFNQCAKVRSQFRQLPRMTRILMIQVIVTMKLIMIDLLEQLKNLTLFKYQQSQLDQTPGKLQ